MKTAREQRHLGESWFLDAVDVGLRVGGHLISLGSEANRTVHLRLEEEKKEQKKKQKVNTPEARSGPDQTGKQSTHPVVPEGTSVEVGHRRPFGAPGGLQVEVVVDVGLIESRLSRGKNVQATCMRNTFNLFQYEEIQEG